MLDPTNEQRRTHAERVRAVIHFLRAREIHWEKSNIVPLEAIESKISLGNLQTGNELPSDEPYAVSTKY